jgi:hypothetical protein
MPLPLSLAGETRVETRNTVYRLRDGVCYSVERSGEPPGHDPSAFVGMRVVGWMRREDTAGVLSLEWEPGSYAVLWRPRAAPADRSAVALTSASIAFLRGERTAPASPHARAREDGRGAPLPLPLAIVRPAPLPRGVAPAVHARSALPERVTPPPPPPLPSRARSPGLGGGGAPATPTKANGQRPLPYRAPILS